MAIFPYILVFCLSCMVIAFPGAGHSETVGNPATTMALAPSDVQWLKDHPRIRIGVDPAYAPYSFRDKKGRYRGIAMEFVDYLGKKLGIVMEVVPDLDWPEIVSSVQERRLDVVATMSYRPEREAFVNFTKIYLPTPLVIMRRSGGARIESEHDLEGRTVALVDGYSSSERVMEEHPASKPVMVKTALEGLFAVATGKADAYVGVLGINLFLSQQNGITNLEVAALYGAGANGQRFGVRKDWPELANIMDKALSAMTEGDQRKLFERWLPAQATKPGRSPLRDPESLIALTPDTVPISQVGFVIQMLAIVFALILVCGFVFWFMRGRPKQFSIRETLFLISFIFAALIVTIGTLVTLLISGEKKQTATENHRYSSYSLALELKQLSDALTRFARTYAVTGDPKYETYFNMVSDIRDGLRPHPSNYTQAFWDHVAAGTMTINDAGETYAINDRFKQLGLAVEEIEKLTLAKRETDDLKHLEIVAMNAVKGRFKDADGEFSVLKAPDLEMARMLLHGQAYHDAKSRIMKHIDDFLILLRNRTTIEVNRIRAGNNALLLGITILICTVIAFSAFVFFLLKRRIIVPLYQLENAAIRVGKGEKAIVPDIAQKNEISQLAEAFNYMLGERHKAEARLRSAKEKTEKTLKDLEHQESRYRSLVGNIPGAVYRCALDEHWTMHYLSDYIEQITGYPPTDFVDNKVRSLASIIHSDDRDLVTQAVLDGVASDGFYTIEYRMIDSEGEIHWVYERGQVIHDATGDVDYLDGFIMNITEKKRLDQAILQAKDDAEAANRAKSIFLATMSHEIRTPMNAILGYSQIMQHDDGLTREQQKNLGIINRSGDHLLDLINDVLEMSKIEAGRIDLTPAPFDLHALIQDVEMMFQLRCDAKRLQFVVEKNRRLPRFITADEGKVRQVLINLLGNAVKFTRKGEIRLHALWHDGAGSENTALDLGGRLVFKVSDTGPGIPREMQEKVFGAFEQTDSGRQVEGGTGLGLAISRQYARMMEGDIKVQSQLGQGSVFRFEMKAFASDAIAPSRDIIDRGTVVRLKDGQPPIRILVVDDRDYNVDILIQMLVRVGFEVTPAFDGKEAVNHFARWRPQAVLMDIRMPVMDGIEAAKRIRDLEKACKLELSGSDFCRTVIFAVSASALENQRKEIMQEGLANEFISKPFKEAEVFELLRQHLGIEYVYQETNPEKDGTEVYTTPEKILNAVAKLQAPLLSELREATINLDVDRIKKLVEQVASLDANLAIHLRHFVDGYDFENLGDLLETT